MRVVVTGLGAVTSIGTSADAFWGSLLLGRSGITKLEHFDSENLDDGVWNAGEIKNIDSDGVKVPSFVGKATKFALLASTECVRDSGIQGGDRVGVVFGTTMGEAQELEKMDLAWFESFSNPVSPERCAASMPYSISQTVAAEFGFYGPNQFLPNACSAGNFTIEKGCELISAGLADAVLVGGAECFDRKTYCGFIRVGAVSRDVPRPFTKDREGMIPAEGAGVLLLESLEHARARKAKIYAEILGTGRSCDAYHITQPDPDGLASAYRIALHDAGISPEQVDFISAHGTGTKANDQAEVKAFRQVFGDNLKNIPINSIKSMIGHAMGAASALEAIMTVFVILTGKIPPTINFTEVDPEFDGLDFVPNVFREKAVNIALETAAGFGGNNSAVIFGKYVNGNV